MSTNVNTSSDEEDDLQHTSHINLPHINLSSIRKQQTKSTPRDNLVKAGKKFHPKNKSVRFPGSTGKSPQQHKNPRDTIISNDSTNNDDSDLDSDYDLDYDSSLQGQSSTKPRRSGSSSEDRALPSFKFTSTDLSHQTQVAEEDDDDDDEDDDEVDPHFNYPPPHTAYTQQEISSDSSDSEDDNSAKHNDTNKVSSNDNNINDNQRTGSSSSQEQHHEQSSDHSEHKGLHQQSSDNNLSKKISPASRHSIGSGSRFFNAARQSFTGSRHSHEHDAHLKRNSTTTAPSLHSSRTGQSDSRGGNNINFKGILRRIALADQAYSNPHAAAIQNRESQDLDDLDLASDAAKRSSQSHGDSFIGRVLNLGGDIGGMSGGGLVPGASNRQTREKPIDEEEEVGGGDHDRNANEDDNSIELKKLNFDEINDEARQLISLHVPGGAKLLKEYQESKQAERERALLNEPQLQDQNNLHPSGSSSNQNNASPPESNNSTTFLVNKEREKAQGETPLASYPVSDAESSPASDFFKQPNPDFNIDQHLANDLQDDEFMMLDDGEGGGYVAPPKQVHAGVLSSLLKLYQNPQESKSSSSMVSGDSSISNDGYDSHGNAWDGSTTNGDGNTTLYGSKNTSYVDFTKFKSGIMRGGRMVKNAPGKIANAGQKKLTPNSRTGTSGTTDDEFDEGNEKTQDGYNADDNEIDPATTNLPSFQNARPKAPKKNPSGSKVPQISKKLKKHKKQQNERLRITVHIADIIQRQRFIMRLCRAFMLFGAPTHRLEDYMVMTSRVLEIDGQFIYFPGCMIMAFGDAATRTSEVHLVKCGQGLNLSKLSDSHAIYKGVIHDLLGVDEATAKLEELLRKKNLYSPWICVFLYGLGSASVCPFAFSGNWYDIPIAFGIGLCVGYLQFFVSSISNLYSSVFEVTASIVVSFIARGIGSIRGGKLFCFGAIAQGSLALILPGYIILCGSLELQSKNLVAGSVRMFYAVIYSLFLGFGITLGAALYGWVDSAATDKAVCDNGHNIDDKWRILFVPLFTLCLGLINQARWRQIPVMIFISSVGYIANYFAGVHFKNITEFTAAIGAFIIGILGNMYSRIWKGMAVSAMLPAIFVQVPSGIASKSTLLSGIDSANQITHSNSSSSESSTGTDVSSLSFGATMVEVSIGISVGLFAAALIVYPFGKRKTSLFTL